MRDLSRYRLVVFDLDGTLTDSRDGKVGGAVIPWLPGRLAMLHRLAAAGVHLAIATNQGGIAMGHSRESDVRAAVERVARTVDPPMAVFIATGHPHAKVPGYLLDDPWRKPRPGMLQAAMQRFGVGPEETLFVGDWKTDMEAAAAAGCDYADARDFFSIGLGEREVA